MRQKEFADKCPSHVEETLNDIAKITGR